ncbi:hypothetical protein [uncultured Megasphaera sp.]|uniref:hypothetical protein n=1 Tax=uncultured Megasphaera sp. TaxID=165188 RepID=UPI0025916F1F|nr:hypothetical protein [uncultured Megasphaera sp.]
MAHIPYGYQIVAGEAVIDEAAAQEIRSFFRYYSECKSISEAAKKSGIKKKHPGTGEILKKKVYLGNGFYPQIIDEHLFRKVQIIRNEIAVKQHRYKSPGQIKELRLITNYRSEKVEKKYDDPYRQAAYAYSKIKEV